MRVHLDTEQGRATAEPLSFRLSAGGWTIHVRLVAGRAEEGNQAPEAEGYATEGRRVRYSEKCAEAVLKLLAEKGRRFTLTEVATELDGSFSSSTVNHTLPEMRRRGVLDNRRDGRGAGYGPVAWSEEQPTGPAN